MCISVILILEDNRATGPGAVGWFNMAIAT